MLLIRIQFFVKRPQYIRIKNPLQKQSEKPTCAIKRDMLELATLQDIIFFRNFDEISKCSVVFFFRRMFSVDELCMFLTHKRRPSKSSLQQILLRLRSLNSFQIGSNPLNERLPQPSLKARVFQPSA